MFVWYGDLIDVGEFIDKYSQQDMYIRLPSSEIDLIHASNRKGKRLVTILLVSSISPILVFWAPYGGI